MDLMTRRRQIMMGASPLVEMTATGNPAAFTAKVSKALTGLTIPFTPVQDLHGYDHPWPAGGGVNKLNPAEMYTSGVVYGFTITINGEEFVFSGTYNSSTVVNPQFRFALYTDQREIPYKCKGFAVDSATSAHYNNFVGRADGNKTLTIQFNNLIEGETYNFRIRIVAYEGDTAPTEWTPYSNICSITGFTGANVTRTGANVFDGECESGYINVTTGQPDSNDNRYRTKNYISVSPDTTYYAKWSAHQTANNVVSRIFYYDANKDYISASGSVYTNGTFTTPSNAWFAKFFVNEAFSNYGNDISINYPATATAYEPYTGTTIPVTFPALGKNLLDFEIANYYNNNIFFGGNEQGGDAVVDGTFVLKAGTYTASANANMTAWYLYDEAGQIGTKYNNAVYTFTLSEEKAVCFRCYMSNTSTKDAFAQYEIQLELGSTATDYEPYTNTAYSGTLDAVTGVLTVDRASVDLGTLDWEYKRSGERSLFTSFGLAQRYKPSGSNGVPVNAIFECYMNVAISVTFKNGEGGFDGTVSSRIVICDNRYTDAATFKTAMDGMQLVYELATPLTFQLDPVTLTALKGNNVLWTDTNGTNTVKYLTRN